MTRTFVLLTALAVAAGLASSCGRSTASAGAKTADTLSCRAALAAFSPRDDQDREIARLQDQARRESHAARALEELGYRYVARARARGADGDYTLAEAAADCLLARHPDHASALLLRGHALHQMHRFDEAEAIARGLVARREFVLDYGLLGDALMEQGKLAEAGQAYQKMVDLKPFYQSYVRAAHLRWLTGDLDGAIESIGLAIGSASPRDPESAAWAYARLAAYEAQAGRLRAAERAAEAALARRADYPAALLAKGRVLLAGAGRRAEAVAALREAARLAPLPEFQWALADALRLAGQDADADAVERALTDEGRRSDPRTVALFLATRRAAPSDAVALAQRELGRRGDVFTLDALAWALAAAGRVHDAEPLIERALAAGTQDARLFLHAAAIATAAGRRADAARWLGKAERLRPMLLPSELDELRTVRSALSATEEN